MITEHDIKKKLWDEKLAPAGFSGMHGAFEAEEFCTKLSEVLFRVAELRKDDLISAFDVRDRRIDALAQMAKQGDLETLTEKKIRSIIRSEVAMAFSEMFENRAGFMKDLKELQG